MERNLVYKSVSSPLGRLYLVASPKGLVRIAFEKPAVPAGESGILAQAARELGEFFGGLRTAFAVPLDLEGTAFQKKVWRELRRIPFGETRSYGDVAKSIGHQRAVRAVGGANGQNPVCVIVPCHRVIAANGLIGGYSGGVDRKIKLLDIEQRAAKA